MNQPSGPFVRASETLQAFADAVPVLIAYLDADLRYRFNNAAYETWFGLKRDDLYGKTAREVVGEAAYARIRPHLERALSGRQVRFSATINYAGSGQRDVEAVYQPELDASGKTVGIFTLVHDVTNSRQQERYGRFLSELSEAVRPFSDPVEIMRETARMLGQRLNVSRCAYAELVGEDDHFTVHADYTDGVASMAGTYPMLILGPAIHQRVRINRPFMVHDVAGSPHTCDRADFYRDMGIGASIFAPVHKEGRFVGGMTVHQKHARHWLAEEVELVQIVATRCWESVERARIARALQAESEKNALFRAAVESANDAILITEPLLDLPGPRIEYVNSAFTEMTGYSPEEIIGRTPRVLQGPRTDLRTIGRIRRDLAETGTFRGETVNYRKDGSEYWVEWRISAVRNGGGQIVNWVAVQRDVTDRRRIESERAVLLESEQRARADAERASSLKDEFLATLSHELRTPLTALLGWTQLLQSRPLEDENVTKALTVIERNALAQARIIEDLLDMSRITSGKVDLKMSDVDLANVIRSAAENLQVEADVRRIDLEVDACSGSIVEGDTDRLQQVTWNLLSNALKFTPEGGHVRVSLEQSDSAAIIKVTDNGCGIPVDFLPHIFDRFRQADSSRSRRVGGLGLGLALVDQIVRMHGGKASATSSGEGKGANFLVELPLARKGDSDTPSAAQPDQNSFQKALQGARILVIEDEPDSREVISRMLGQEGAIVLAAKDGETALRQLEEHPFDLIVSDIGMPGMDGFQLIRKIREGGNRERIPVIALTAYARKEDRQAALDCGFDAHVAKPVRIFELVRTAIDLLRAEAPVSNDSN